MSDFDQKAVEAMARAICRVFEFGENDIENRVDASWSFFVDEATAALAAYRQCQAEAGVVEVRDFDLAQLRHAYAQLAAGTVKDQKQFADGLLAPLIRRIEAAQETKG